MPYLSERTQAVGKLIALIAVLAALVASLILLAVGGFGGQQDNTETSASVPSTTSSTTAHPGEFTDAHDETPNLCGSQSDQLRKLTVAIAKAWYQIEPNDTTKTRRARLATLVSQDFYRIHTVVVDRASPADQARIAEGHVFSATAKSKDVTVVCSADFDSEAATGVNVQLLEKTASGTAASEPLTVHVSVHWRLEGFSWRATTLEEKW